MAEVHYEIFRMVGRGGGWSMVEAITDREVALKKAKDMLTAGEAAAVKVVKETLTDSGDYLTLSIFEDGKIETKKKKGKSVDQDAENPVACFKPDDLYSYHARTTIARLLAEWLTRQRLTVSELLHSAAGLEKLEATGTTFQHAVQKVAVAQAAESETPVSQIIKSLNDLSTKAINRVYRDEKGLFPKLTPAQFLDFVKKLSDAPDGPYLLGGALAKYLAPAKGWDEKLQLVLALMPQLAQLPAEGPARKLLLSAIDTIVAELLNGAAALGDLLGHSPDLGHALFNLTRLFLGQPLDAAEGASAGINHLASYFSKDDLPGGRAAIASRILTELRGTKRLSPDSMEDELKTLRKLANLLVRGQGKYLSNEDLIGAFVDRSKRMVSQERVLSFIQGCKTGDEKIERLLVIEENVIGAENKRTLANYMIPIVEANDFEEQVAAGAPAVQRLKRVAELQQRVLRSGLQESQKAKISQRMDGLAVRIEARAGVLMALERRIQSPVERAQAILRLCTGEVLTQGELSNKAQRQLRDLLGQPGFLATYVEQTSKGKEGIAKADVIKDLTDQLEKAGIASEEGRRILAA